MEKLLSVCLITKDEEAVIRRCLESVKDLADEIIVVDTGSTDSTKEIAREFTSHVYDFEWVNDFSVARNESLRYATCKWILVLDADEYINKDDTQEYRLFLRDEPNTGDCTYSISVVSYVGESITNATLSTAPIPRLFPNFKGFKYYRPIHEQLTNETRSSFFSSDSPITAYHTGYLKDVLDFKNKLERNQKIFTVLKQKSGFTPYDLYTIGNEHAVRGDAKKALYNYERALNRASATNPWMWHCAVHLINIYISLDRIIDAMKVINKVFTGRENYPEPHCLKGLLYVQAGMLEQAKPYFLKAIEVAENLSKQQDIFWLVNPSLGSIEPLRQLRKLAEIEHDTEKLTYYSIKLLQASPYDYKTLIELLKVLIVYETDEAILNIIRKLYPDIKPREHLVLYKIFTDLGHSEFSKHFYHLLGDSVAISDADKLNYSLIQSDKEYFISIVRKLSKPIAQKDLLLPILLGTCIFELTPLVSREDIDTSILDIYDTYIKLLNGNTWEKAWIEDNTLSAFQLLNKLFHLRQYDRFDVLINNLNNETVNNLIANFFYSHYLTDLAVDYFNLLLDEDMLSPANYVHFATLHFNQNLNDEGIPYLIEAINLMPETRHLYAILLSKCSNNALRDSYKQKYFALSAQFSKLPDSTLL